MLCVPAKGLTRVANDRPRFGILLDLQEFWAMEGITAACQRDIRRAFQIDRHSSLMLANAFELLLAQNQPADSHPTSGQRIQDDAAQQSLQEDTE